MTLSLDLTHHFLLAMPNLADPNFRSTLTYICEHNEQGAMGLIINRPIQLQLRDILPQMAIELQDPAIGSKPIHYGGPVENSRGFVLHTPMGDWEATISLQSDLGVTSSRDILAAMAEGKGPEKSLIALGYSGWGAGQLEQELTQNSWLTCAADPHILFELEDEQKLAAAAAKLGIDLSLLSGDAGHA